MYMIERSIISTAGFRYLIGQVASASEGWLLAQEAARVTKAHFSGPKHLTPSVILPCHICDNG